jgi:hypothetical protein
MRPSLEVPAVTKEKPHGEGEAAPLDSAVVPAPTQEEQRVEDAAPIAGSTGLTDSPKHTSQTGARNERENDDHAQLERPGTTGKPSWLARSWRSIRDWFRNASFSRELSLFDGLLTVASAIGLWFLIEQSKEIKRTNDQTALALVQSAEATRIQNRAWVGAVGFPIPDLQAGKKAVCKVEIKNTGATPALNVRQTRAMRIINPNEPFSESYVIPLTNGGVLHPGATVWIAPQSKGPLTKIQVDDILSGKQIYRVYGLILYDDIFGCHHRTKFCFFVDAIGTSVCEEYNAAEDYGDCPPKPG